MKWYYGSLLFCKRQNGVTTNNHVAVFHPGTSLDDVKGVVIVKELKRWPAKDGWSLDNVNLYEVPSDVALQVARDYGFAAKE
jgi:hypothetical protein